MILFLGFRVKAATPGKPGAPGKSDHDRATSCAARNNDSAGDLRVLESQATRAYSLIRPPGTVRTGDQRGPAPGGGAGLREVDARYISEVHRRSMESLAWLSDRGWAGRQVTR